MAPYGDGLFHASSRNHFADSAAHTGSLGFHDDALFHIVSQNILGRPKGCRRNVKILQTHLFNQNLRYEGCDIVTVSKLRVEGEGHAVMRAAFFTGLAD